MSAYNTIKVRIRKIKWLHAITSFISYYFIKPFSRGYYMYMVKYLWSTYRGETKKLRVYGFTNIEIFKSRSWRIGRERDKAYRRYYSGLLNGSKCFIKIATNDLTIINEIEIAKKISPLNFVFSPKALAFDEHFGINTKMLAIEYKELHPIAKDNDIDLVTKEELVNYCKQGKLILEALENVGVIHADIHKGNLLVDNNERLWLLDYGISKIINESNCVDYKSRPGTFYLQEGNTRTYDDAYSFVEMINKFPQSDNIKQTKEYCDIYSRIGKITFVTTIK